MLHRFILILVIASLITYVGISHASGAITVSPVGAGAGVSSGGGITYPVSYSASGGGAANSAYYSRSAFFDRPSLGASARAIVRGGVYAAALIGAIAAVGYFIDEITRDIYAKRGKDGHPPVAGLTWYVNGTQTNQTTPSAAANWYFQNVYTYEGDPYSHIRAAYKVGDGNSWYYLYKLHWNNGIITDTLQVTPSDYSLANQWVSNSTEPDDFAATAPELATDEQLGQMVQNAPQTWPEVIATPNGDVYPWAPVTANYPSVALAHATSQGLNPDPYIPPETNPNPDTPPDAGAQATPWPSFCTWASVVCNALKEKPDDPPDVDLPEMQIQPIDWTSGLGTGTCPPPTSIALTIGTYSMSWQPVCDLAAGIKAMLLISAALMAAYILAGASSRA